MSQSRHLVIGASGFLGSHVVRRLAESGHDVTAFVRSTSSLRGIEDLDVPIRYGDVLDADSLRLAMAGIDVVHHCVVDARPWLRDPSPMTLTNVEGLRTVLDVAHEHHDTHGLRRFVYTSSMGTLPLGHPEDPEAHEHDWLDRCGAYVRTRVEGERLALSYATQHGLPVVALCVANTYGPGDHLPTPHGGLLRDAVRGRLPFYVRGAGGEVVDVRDAAEAFLLAADRGRTGERYAIATEYLTTRDLHDRACDHAGTPRSRFGIPAGVLAAAGLLGEAVRASGREVRLTRDTVRLMHVWGPLSHAKATRDLGWSPRPVEETVRDATDFFTRRHQENS